MQRFIFQSAVINKDGLYRYQPLSLEQATAWLIEGPDPVFRLPLIGSVVSALTGKEVTARPGERLFLHTDDEALIMHFEFPEDLGRPGYKRGLIATQPRSLTPTDLRDHMQFGLVRKFARLDGYTQSITQWDSALRDRRWRYLVHDAVLTQYGTYQFGRCAVDEALEWLDEGPYESQLRYDGTCKALECLTDSEITLWESNSRASLAMQPGDRALVAYFHYPNGQKPSPFDPYTEPISPEYARAHTSLSLLTRLSEEFLEMNARAFPAAARVPGEMRAG